MVRCRVLLVVCRLVLGLVVVRCVLFVVGWLLCVCCLFVACCCELSVSVVLHGAC